MAKKDLSQVAVQSQACKTCPFEGTHPIELCPSSKQSYVENVSKLQGQHLSHSAQNKMICRGGRNIMLKALYEGGFIREATDEAYDTARKQILGF